MTEGSVPISVPANFTPRHYQLPVLEALDKGIKRVLLCWPRRAGKDKTCFCYLIKAAATVRGNYFYVFPTSALAKRSLWEVIDSSGMRVIDHIPKEFVKRINQNELRIELINGSTIRVIGFDKDPDAIRGASVHGAVISEAAFSDPIVMKNMVPSVRETRGFLLINSTPNGMNHFYQYYKTASKSKKWFCSKIQTVWPDKPDYVEILTEEDLRAAREEDMMPEDEIAREFGTSFTTGRQGSIYGAQVEKCREERRVGYFPYDENMPVNLYFDLGSTDSTSIWFAQKSGNAVFFIDYFEEKFLMMKDIVQMLKEKGYHYDCAYMPHDADRRVQQASQTLKEQYEEAARSFGISDFVICLPRTQNKLNGISSVRKRFHKFRFNEATTELGLKRVGAYSYVFNKNLNDFTREPKHDENSHAADALRTEAESEQYHDEQYEDETVQVMEEDYNLYWDM